MDSVAGVARSCTGPGLVGDRHRPPQERHRPTCRRQLGRPAEGAVDLLADLVAIYDAGRREPLPLPIKTSYAWAEASTAHGDPERAAGFRWRSNDRYPGEDAENRHTNARGARVLWLSALIDAGLDAYACRLWLPMLRALDDVMERFDLLGPLPAERSTTVLEASAGTGKTFALAGLVTRYVAEGAATLDQMLLITFSRAATQELRDRVRRQIVDAVTAFDDPSLVGDNQVVAHLLKGTPDELQDRRRRLRDALAAFDAATIATTHQFCQLVLKSLGVAGDTDAGVTLVESLDELVAEIVDDLYLRHFGRERDDPLLAYADALRLAREVVNNPATELRPHDPDPDSRAGGVRQLRERCSGRTGDPQAAARHPRLRRPAQPTGRRAESR